MNLRKFKQHIGFFVSGALVVVAILVWIAVFARAQGLGQLEVYFFDVGQGKAIFIEEPGGNQILIDGGPDNSILAKLAEVMPFYDRQIDMLILTHPDSDHLNGLIEVVKRYQVGEVIETGIINETPENQEWERTLKEKNIKVVFAHGGERIKAGEGVVLEILFPNRSLAGESPSDTNGSSIVARLDYGKNSFLFTGDTESQTESFLIGSGADIDADILDVSHHGSKNSTGEEFIAAVSPDIAVIQAGRDNRYGHPHQETLERLSGVEALRTDICGDIGIFSDGQKYSVVAGCQ